MDLTSSTFSSWFDSVDNVLLDCDGVLWAGSSSISGAAEAVALFRAAGKRVFFVSNNSTKTRAQYITQLSGHGIDASVEEVVASAFVTARYLIEAGVEPGSKVYVVGETGLHEELRAVGLVTLGQEDEGKHVKLSSFTKESLDHEVRAVVVGLDSRFTYYKLATAVSYLRYVPGCRFFATNSDRTFPSTDMMLPGSGTLVHMVSFAAEREPEAVVGKPSPKMLEVLSHYAKIDLKRSLMVGDRLNTDIEFGKRQGLRTLLVLTGVSTREEALAEPEDSHRRPEHIIQSLGHLVPFMSSSSSSGSGCGDGSGDSVDSSGK